MTIVRTLKAFLVGSLITIAVSCSDPPQATHDSTTGLEPYGVWSWDNRYVLVLTRSSTYSFCDSSECFIGTVDLTNPQYVWLVDFYSRPLAARFGHDAFQNAQTFDVYRRAAANSTRPDDLDFSPGRVQSNLVSARCGDRPCVVIGHLHEGAVFTRLVDF